MCFIFTKTNCILYLCQNKIFHRFKEIRMKTLNFTINIQASAEMVWFVLWDSHFYTEWTHPFCEGTYYKTDWEEGGRIQFLTPDGSGMYSTIAVNKPFEKMYFSHIGDIKNFEEQPLDEKTRLWTGAREHYDLNIEHDGSTTLLVTLDMADEYVDYFNEKFGKALDIVQLLSEKGELLVTTTVNAPIEKVWDSWTNPQHIVGWNNASEDWHTPKAENDLRVGGRFVYTMAAKDGSFSFDFGGTYSEVIENQAIAYSMDDNRTARILFENTEKGVLIKEYFQGENMHPLAFQKMGWQAILDNFKRYTEGG